MHTIKTRFRMSIIAAIKLFFLQICIFLTACGGGGASTNTVSVEVKAAPKTVTVAMYGDSTVYGLTYKDNEWKQALTNEPAQLQQMLREKYGDRVTVINNGINGKNAVDLINGVPGARGPWADEMKAQNAQIIVINIGINDASTAGWTPQYFADNVSTLIKEAQKNGKTVIIETSNPTDNPSVKDLDQFVDAELHVARSLGTVIIDQYGYLSQFDWRPMTIEGIHPTEDGYVLKSQKSYSIIDPVVSAMLAKS